MVSLSGRWGCLKLTTRGQSTRTAKDMSKVMTLAWPLTLPINPGLQARPAPTSPHTTPLTRLSPSYHSDFSSDVTSSSALH